MRYLHLLVTLLLFSSSVMAQTNFMNNIWMGGDFYGWSYTPRYYMSLVNHSPDDFVAVTDSVPIPQTDIYEEVEFSSGTAVLSDSAGKIVIYTNGCKFFDGEHQFIPGSDSLGMNNYYCVGGADGQPGFFLPINDSIVDHIVLSGSPRRMFRTRFIIRSDGSIDFLFFNATFFLFEEYAENITAVRHGNGKDWWIHSANPNPEDSTDGYEYMFLLTEAGIVDTIEYESEASGVGFSTITFSPDGQWMLRSTALNSVQLFRVDRCTGIISDLTLLDVPDHWNFFTKSAAFTADSRFIYGSNFDSLWRFDMEAPDINASREFVAVHDGDFSEFDTDSFDIEEGTPLALVFRNSFGDIRLGRNGVIYIGQGYCGSRYMHLVNKPSAPIAEVDFQLRGVTMPTRSWCHVPTVVEYELRDAPGSPCDTLGINGGLGIWSPPLVFNNEVAQSAIHIAPNPASNTVRCQIEGQFIKTAQVFNAQGALVAEQTLLQQKDEVQFDVTAFPEGLYMIQLTSTTGYRFAGNVLVAR